MNHDWRSTARVERQAREPVARLVGWILLGVTLLAAVAMAGCWSGSRAPFRLLAGTGFSSYEPLLKHFAAQHGVALEITYRGSLDIMRMLEEGRVAHDAIWDADSLWTSLGDTRRLIRHQKSIACSPVVFALKRSRAEALGWIGKATVGLPDILEAIEVRGLRVMMTSASQSNSGASAYFGFLHAFAGRPPVLTAAHLEDPHLRDKVRRLLGTVRRTSESSGFLRDLFVREADRYDAMFNYESHVIAANRDLVGAGREPLYVVYPVEGLGVADFPLSYVKGDAPAMEALVLRLQQFLLSAEGQREIAAQGRRVGPLCDRLDPAAVRADWGIDPARTLNAPKLPAAPVIWQALNLYQTTLRKPSLTVYCLDFSGSMRGAGAQQLKRAMRMLLDQREAATHLLQAGADDVTIVIPFDGATAANDVIEREWTVPGNSADALRGLLDRIERRQPDGGTNIYGPVAQSLGLLRVWGTDGRVPAIILMTDGQSNAGSLEDVRRAMLATGLRGVPVHGITFGDANRKQLEALATLTGGRVFDGTRDLLAAFRRAKGNH